MMTKEEAIQRFKDGCDPNDVEGSFNRKFNYATQHQRNVWQINNKKIGIVRIENFGQPKITVYNLINDLECLPIEIDITLTEYKELEKLYKK